MPASTSPAEKSRIFTEVASYATRIAEMVKTNAYFEAVECPAIPEHFSDEESSDEEDASQE